jgi:hypothetical protein
MPGQTKKSAKRAKRRKLRVRLPLPKKPGRPMSTPKGKKGYDRKREREEIERDGDEG